MAADYYYGEFACRVVLTSRLDILFSVTAYEGMCIAPIALVVRNLFLYVFVVIPMYDIERIDWGCTRGHLYYVTIMTRRSRDCHSGTRRDRRPLKSEL